jgi:hypothetical protein
VADPCPHRRDFLEWAATATGARADDGVETLVVRDGEIVLQTAR